jgi:hypothetical protein
MARFFPATEADMLQLTGVGEKRLARYGQRFMDAIATFREAHPDIEPPASLSAQATLISEPSRITDPESRIGDAVPTYVEETRKKHPRAYEKWSDEEDENLRQAWEQSADAEESGAAKIRTIAADFDRKPGAIRSRLKKLGLT